MSRFQWYRKWRGGMWLKHPISNKWMPATSALIALDYLLTLGENSDRTEDWR